MGIKLSNDDVRKVFKHIDVNNDGKIGFNQFVQLSEENRIDLNPYTPISKVTSSAQGSRST